MCYAFVLLHRRCEHFWALNTFVRLFKEIPGGRKNKKTPWSSFSCCLTDGKVTKQPVDSWLSQSIYSSAYWLSKPFFRAATQCCGCFTTDPQRKTGTCYCILTSLVSLWFQLWNSALTTKRKSTTHLVLSFV